MRLEAASCCVAPSRLDDRKHARQTLGLLAVGEAETITPLIGRLWHDPILQPGALRRIGHTPAERIERRSG